MMRVISSPSSSTTGLFTLIFAIAPGAPLGSANSTSVLDARTLHVRDVRLLGAYSLGGLPERRQLVAGQRRLDHPAHAAGAQLGLHTQVDAADAVLPVDPRAHRPDLAGVLRDRPRHARRGGRRGVVGGAGLQQRDDLRTAVAGTGDQ